MSSWLIGHEQRFRAAAIGAPVTNLLSMYGQTDIAASFGELQWGGLPQDRLEHYLERSPVMYVDAIETPVLLQHGDADIRVPISQSEELFAALKRRGKTVEFIRYPGLLAPVPARRPPEPAQGVLRPRGGVVRALAVVVGHAR